MDDELACVLSGVSDSVWHCCGCGKGLFRPGKTAEIVGKVEELERGGVEGSEGDCGWPPACATGVAAGIMPASDAVGGLEVGIDDDKGGLTSSGGCVEERGRGWVPCGGGICCEGNRGGRGKTGRAPEGIICG